jgi:hypothetical protein
MEHYLASVLPFGGRHGQAVDNLRNGVPKRLANNQKLKEKLSIGMEPAWMREGDGLYQQTTAFPFDGSQLEGLLGFIARGLAWHHWKFCIPQGSPLRVIFLPNPIPEHLHRAVRACRGVHRVIENLGRDTVQYEGIQSCDSPELTIWVISMYGGILLSDSRGKPGTAPIETSSKWLVMTGQEELELPS